MDTRRHIPRLAALAPALLLFAFARVPELPADARRELAQKFRFRASPLPVLTPSSRTMRAVRPDLEHLAAWISSVGAAVALNDLDGDGLPNDVAYVDVRSDEVVVAPVPGSEARYASFDLLRAAGCAAASSTAPMGSVPSDVDEDGDLDVLVYFWGRSPLLYLRDGMATISARAYRCQEVVTPREEWYTNAATFADVDGDGHADLVAGNYFPDGAGVLDPRATSERMEMQDSMSAAFNGGANRLLLLARDASGRVVFRDASYAMPARVAHAWTLAVGAQDLDGDLLPELYFANDFGPDRLLRNHSVPGRPAFSLVEGTRDLFQPKSKVIGRDSFKGMGVDFADLNGDAKPDIFVSNITDEYALEESNLLFLSRGDGYRDEGERLGLSRGGWAWDARFGDFDNDGTAEALQAAGFVAGTVDRWPELHELAMSNDTLLRHELSWPRFRAGTDLSGGNHNPFFVRASDGRYYDLARELGIDAPSVSRGIATADVDGDGRLDFATGNQWRASQFFHNESPRRSSYLVLHLRLPVHGAASTTVIRGAPHGEPSSAAIGAAVRVMRDGGPVWIGQVDGGNGHSGKRSHELHAGLGRASSAAVEVRWRDRGGRVRMQAMRLAPGVYTVLLANGEGQ